MLADIMKESDSYYQPKKDLYNQQLSQTDPQQQAEVQGLQQQQQDSFSQIRDQAQRRGLFFSGIPLAEQAKYTASQFLPAVANLQGKYRQQRFGLENALTDLGSQQYSDAMGIQQKQIDREFQAQQAELSRQASAASAANTGYQPTASVSNANTATDYTKPDSGMTLRQTWQREANQGDWNAQVALNYAGDTGRYDGAVNSQAEYDILKNMGIQGNYYAINTNQPVKLGTSNPTVVPWSGTSTPTYSGLKVVSQ